MEEKQLDYVLVPLGLAVFGIYHVWLLISILRYPTTTVVGLNAQSRRQWVFSMMTVSLPLLSMCICVLICLRIATNVY